MAAPILTQEMTLLKSNIKVTANDPITGLNSSEAVGGKIYQSKISLDGDETSNAILIPQGQISDIRFDADKAAAGVYITLSSKEDIEADEAIWTALTISGITSIPPACNAIYIVGNASASIILINVRMIGG